MMTTSRAAEVAEVLWELKRADKIATFSSIAKRAGFSAGTNGRSVVTTMKAVRKNWPHLQWWRAVKDDGLLEKGSEQESKLRECGYETVPADGRADAVTLKEFTEHLMSWEEPVISAAADGEA